VSGRSLKETEAAVEAATPRKEKLENKTGGYYKVINCDNSY
jgi:hypothetical protein